MFILYLSLQLHEICVILTGAVDQPVFVTYIQMIEVIMIVYIDAIFVYRYLVLSDPFSPYIQNNAPQKYMILVM